MDNKSLKFEALTDAAKRQNTLIKKIYEVADSAYDTGSPWKIQAFRSDIFRPESQYFVIYEDQQLIGFLGTTVVLDQIDITNVAVLPAKQNQHVGRKLFTEWFKTLDKGTQLFLEVRVSNLSAIKLYQSLGFVKVGQRKRYYRDPEEDANLLKKIM